VNRIVLAAVLALACSSFVLAAPSVPTRGAVKGDVVRMNQFFHIEDDNLRVASIRWISSGDPLATTISNLPQMSSPTAPNGYLLFTVPQKNTSKNPQPAQYLKITVFYKDGTQADDGDGVPWSTAYKQLLYNTTYYPGEGVTTYFIIANVPQPTQQNPITKLILSDPGMQNAPGYPKLYRLLDPIVKP